MSTQQSERTAQDYALEHAEYLAKDAARLIAAVNTLAKAEQDREEGVENEVMVNQARESLSEAVVSTRSAIYEFRKRRDRVQKAEKPVALQVASGYRAVRLPVTEEMHVAAVKVLHRANGVDGLPQRMLEAMLAVMPEVTPTEKEGKSSELGEKLRVSDEVWSSLQRMVESAVATGEVSRVDARCVAQWHDRLVSAGEAEMPTKWIDDPHDIEGGQMLNPDWLARKSLTAAQAFRPSSLQPGLPAPGADRDVQRYRNVLKHLIRAYVNLMAAGRERILDFGGQCDPLEVMERNDPNLRMARTVLEGKMEKSA